MTPDNELEQLADDYAQCADGSINFERSAGYIAGFRACEKMMKDRFPTREEMKEIAKHEDSDGYFGFMSGYDWLKQKLFGDVSKEKP